MKYKITFSGRTLAILRPISFIGEAKDEQAMRDILNQSYHHITNLVITPRIDLEGVSNSRSTMHRIITVILRVCVWLTIPALTGYGFVTLVERLWMRYVS